jgi:hypothetical protein
MRNTTIDVIHEYSKQFAIEQLKKRRWENMVAVRPVLPDLLENRWSFDCRHRRAEKRYVENSLCSCAVRWSIAPPIGWERRETDWHGECFLSIVEDDWNSLQSATSIDILRVCTHLLPSRIPMPSTRKAMERPLAPRIKPRRVRI